MPRYSNIALAVSMKIIFCFCFMFVVLFSSFSQVEIPAPEMYSVSVDPETGFDIIIWYTCASPDIEYYTIGIAVVTIPGEPYSLNPVGTIYVPDTVFINTDLESSLHSVGYSVFGVDDLGGGIFTPGHYEDPPDSTIFLEADFDSCEANISLAWNDYNKWRGSIQEYRIYRRRGAGLYELLGSTSEGTNEYIITNIDINQEYQLFVEAVNTDGRQSTSNRVDVITRMTNQPDFLNADYATISDENTIDLSFTLDPASDLTHYDLMRSNTPAGSFDQIASFNTTDTKIDFTDNVPFRSGVYYYRLDAINNCGQPAFQSNLANNIIVNGSVNNNRITLMWNDYLDWSGGVENYQLTRTIGRDNPQVSILNTGLLTNYTDDVTALFNYEDPVSCLFCYQVKATERLNALGIQGTSISNEICFTIKPNIMMPNAFIPNDDNQVNRVFEPVFSLIPEHYEMIIYNRLGNKIWEGSDGWDGRVNGKYVPEGVYLYYLRVFNYSSDITELNGKVVVIYR